MTDNVLVVTQSCSATSGAQFPIGVTIVKCTGADAAGNTGRCQFPISIVGKSKLGSKFEARIQKLFSLWLFPEC